MPRWIWPAALTTSAFGTATLYQTLPGLSWPLWVIAVSVGLALLVRQRSDQLRRPTYTLLALAIIASTGMSATDDDLTQFGIIVLDTILLACAMLTTPMLNSEAITPFFVAKAPFRALWIAIHETLHRSSQKATALTSTRARPVLRGTFIALALVSILAVLLSTADPTLASWRLEVLSYVPTWTFVPRTIFFCILLTCTLGAYSWAQSAKAVQEIQKPTARTWLGVTELRIILTSVTALLYLFIVLQISYLFGNAPQIAGSGITYAEYARRGFGEMTIAATIVVLLVMGTEHEMALNKSKNRIISGLGYALIAAVMILLASALYRIDLYEFAYGYTNTRVYGRVLILMVMAAVVALTIELARGFHFGRITRQFMMIGVVTFIGITWWNEDAWIARKNIEQFLTSPNSSRQPLDVAYLARLSQDATPAIATAMTKLPPDLQAQLIAAIKKKASYTKTESWYTWNYRRWQAQKTVADLSTRMID